MSSPRFDLRRGVTEPIVLLISRREVEAGDNRSTVDRLLGLFNTPELIWRYRGQMTLVVDGYNDDLRELVDIAEVRSTASPASLPTHTTEPRKSRRPTPAVRFRRRGFYYAVGPSNSGA